VGPSALRYAMLAVAYYATHQLGYLFFDPVAQVSPVWPATGLAVAVLLLSPRSRWPGIIAVFAAGNLFSNLESTHGALLVSLGFLAANALEVALAVWMIDRFGGGSMTFTRMPEVLALTTAACLATRTGPGGRRSSSVCSS